MKFFKKLGIASFIDVIAAILILVSMILTIVSSSCLGYEISKLNLVVVFSIVVIICLFASIALSAFFGNKLYSYLPMLVACVLSGLCFYFVIDARTYLIGTIWVTSLDSTNEYAVKAMGTGGPAFIMYCATMLIIAVAAFFNLVRNNKKVEELPLA